MSEVTYKLVVFARDVDINLDVKIDVNNVPIIEKNSTNTPPIK